MRAARRARLIRRLATVLHASGGTRALARLAGHRRRTPGFMVLTYHRVNDEGDPFLPAVPTRVFEQQMRHVAGTYQVLPVEELAERAARGALPPLGLAITFDDGYRDTLTHAAPILARHGLPATVFLATGFIGGGEVPWVDRLAVALKSTRQEVLRTPWGATFSLATPAERLAALERLLAYLKRLADEDCRRAVDALVARLRPSQEAAAKTLMLTWDDVHALRGLGFRLGAHTVNHPILTRVSLERAWTEILGSRTMIASACGEVPRAFAYPNGRPEDYSPAVTRLVQEAGFTCAATTRFGINTRATPPFELRRGGPWETHLPTFALKLAWYRLWRADGVAGRGGHGNEEG
jgi:peptidoglycan/xylan/chitin deacetylase (PgdA/CDA1 family)